MVTELVATMSPKTGRRLRGRSRARWLAFRVLQGVVILVIVSLVVFFATQAMPGDVAQVILGTTATPERIAALRAELGLDQPLLTQYWTWLTGVLSGDLGDSLVSGQPVSDLLADRLKNSFILSGISLLVMFPLSLVIGIIAAQYRDKIVDKGYLGVSMIAAATPEFVIGMVLVFLFGTTVFRIFPPVSIIPPGDLATEHPASLVLPVATLTIIGAVYLSRLVRASFIDVMDSEYVENARLKGLSTRRILYVHALPNALAPVIPAASLVAAHTIGGIVVVEFLFAYPGIGSALVDAVGNRDLPVIQAIILIIAASYFVLNFIADVVPGGGQEERR